jgi:hypothetical protein
LATLNLMRDGLLLCELHAHSTWSDGELSVADLVDLYGRAGFDVLCVTDHTVRLDDPTPRAVDPWIWPAHAAAVRAERERAWSEYGLILIQGLELTDNQDDAAHAQGAAVMAAHPYAPTDATPLRATRRIWQERELLGELIHRYELFNRREVFSWVAAEELPPVATGDFHRLEHLSSWKTLLPCERDAEAVVEHLRSHGQVFLMPFGAAQATRLPVAA